ncbi:MAG TPA: hypothetical protein VFB38_24755 [Chthonomonadaceae bacterium]|nr:hypothetical protein [Chthonomonadaceae bacterium]
MSRKASGGMACWQCPRYSRAERRCLDGKANPKSKADSVAVAELLGVRALCHYNLYRDALALRTYLPNAPATLALARKPQPAAAGGRIEVEILED